MGTSRSAMEKRNWFIKRFNLAKERGISLSKERLISEFCLNFYSKRQTATDFIKHFKEIGLIKISGDEIFDTENTFDEIWDEVKDTWTKLSEEDKKALRGAKNVSING